MFCFNKNEIIEKGRVCSVKDNVIEIIGLSQAFASEILFVEVADSKIDGKLFSNKYIRCIVLTLFENSISAILLGDERLVVEGCCVVRSNELLILPSSFSLFGTVCNALGDNVDNENIELNDVKELNSFIEKKAVGIIDRVPVNIPLRTGIKSIDSLIPIGRGQRELIIGDRQTGKTSLVVDTILNHVYQNNIVIGQLDGFKVKDNVSIGNNEINQLVFFVYCAIGQKRSSVSNFYYLLKRYNALWFTSIIMSTASESASLQFLAPYTACTLGEFVRDCGSSHCVVIYDDLSKHAVAYRQMSLLLRRPPGREAFPGDVFYLHSRLLERAGSLTFGKNYSVEFNGIILSKFLKLDNFLEKKIVPFCLIDNKLDSFFYNFLYKQKRGTLTAFPIIETQAGDVAAYIPTNVISITDGQIFLETELFYKGIRPAVNVGLSVSRVGSAAQPLIVKRIAGSLKNELAQYREIEGFAKLGASLDEHTQRLLLRGSFLVEILKQKLNNPLLIFDEVFSIFLGIGSSVVFKNIELKFFGYNLNYSFSYYFRRSLLNYKIRATSTWLETIAECCNFFDSKKVVNFIETILYYFKCVGFNYFSSFFEFERILSRFVFFIFDDLFLTYLLKFNGILGYFIVKFQKKILFKKLKKTFVVLLGIVSRFVGYKKKKKKQVRSYLSNSSFKKLGFSLFFRYFGRKAVLFYLLYCLNNYILKNGIINWLQHRNITYYRKDVQLVSLHRNRLKILFMLLNFLEKLYFYNFTFFFCFSLNETI